MKVAFRVALVLLIAAILYRGLFVQLQLFDVIANVLLLCAVAAGVAGGPDRGAVVGFFAGLLMDLLLPTAPLGLSALTFCIVGFVVGRYQGTVVRSSRLVTMAVVGLASAGGMLLYIAVAQLVNQVNFVQRQIWVVVLVVSVVNALLAPLAVRIMRWAFAMTDRDLRTAMR